MPLLDLLKALVLGLVEGATEFIPVSSTGHLIIVSDWLRFGDGRANSEAFVAAFNIFIQLGAILAIVWLYRGLFWDVARGLGAREPERRRRAWRFALNLLVAFLPAAVIGLAFNDQIEALFERPAPIAAALVLGGVAILLIERWSPPERVPTVEAMTPKFALGVGLAQVLSLFPGVSRSGATILGGYSIGLSRKAATEFSFFLAVPVMVAASLFKLVDNLDALTAADVPTFAVGFVVSFASALVVVKAFLRFVSSHRFTVFAWYRIAFGLLVLAYYGLAG
jgi:undecaprenyl-diphosphatase